jgi:ubiquinone/menaquinone biosynthesis C-methylase UbiE
MNPQALWNNWDEEKHYGELLFKRATGESEEMNSSKAISKIIKEFYKPGMKVLDVGCGAGHYLVSLRKIVDPSIDYTGLDPTVYYLDLARKAFGNTAKFIQGGVFDIPLESNSYDIVICNHVILHMPPENIKKAFNELVRVSKKVSITRTVFGERNYIIREILNHNDLKPENPLAITYDNFDLTQHNFRYFNMFTPEFIRQMILSENNVKMDIRDDRDFTTFDNTSKAKINTATKTVGKMQVSGNLILDYKFIITKKS